MTEFNNVIKEVLECQKHQDEENPNEVIFWNTIIHALKVADKLMQDPSDAVMLDGYHEYEEDWIQSAGDIFRTMRDQMLKEIEQEQHH